MLNGMGKESRGRCGVMVFVVCAAVLSLFLADMIACAEDNAWRNAESFFREVEKNAKPLAVDKLYERTSEEYQLIYKILDVSDAEKSMPELPKARIWAAYGDVNDDGNNEIFAYVQHFSLCGTGGCSFSVLQKQGESKWRILADNALDNWDVSISAFQHNGYRDLLFSINGKSLSENVHRAQAWIFDGKEYVPYLEKEDKILKNKNIKEVSLWEITRDRDWKLLGTKTIRLK